MIYKLASNCRDFSSVIHNRQNGDSIQSLAIDRLWKPFNEDKFNKPTIDLYRSDTGKVNFKSDIFSDLSPFFVFSEKAIEALKDIFEPRGQFLPITMKSKRKKFMGYYPTNHIQNGFDQNLSEYSDIGYGHGVILFKPVLIKNKFENEYLFSLSEARGSVFVTDKFKKRVEEADLEGFDFTHKVKTV